jgi:disulfide bond formation protein DsbB
MTRFQRRALGAGVASGLMLLAALAFQYLGDLPPCPLCIWQRWPHAVGLVLGLVAVRLPWRGLAVLGALAALTTAGIGVFHLGVEQGWWEGLTTCAAPSSIEGLTPEQLMEQIMAAPVVRCEDVLWSFAGISMAGWNAILSLGIAVLWLRAYASSSASQ